MRLGVLTGGGDRACLNSAIRSGVRMAYRRFDTPERLENVKADQVVQINEMELW
jgi:6-phosphofructokinase